MNATPYNPAGVRVLVIVALTVAMMTSLVLAGSWGRPEMKPAPDSTRMREIGTLAIKPAEIDFGGMQVCQIPCCTPPRAVSLTNTGASPIDGTLYVTGPDALDFQVAIPQDLFPIPPGCERRIQVRFCPHCVGGKNATLVAHAYNTRSVTCELYGYGVNGGGGEHEFPVR